MPADVGIWGALACMLGRHIRSRGAARSAPEGWRSKCARCGVPMVRSHGGGKWTIVKAPLTQDADIHGEAAPSEAMVAAITRSRRGGHRREQRDELKAQKAARKAAALQRKAAVKAIAAATPRKGLLRPKVAPATGFAAIATAAQIGEAPPKRALFKRKPKADAAVPKGVRFRRKAKGEVAGDADVSMTDGTADESVAKPKRGLLGRKRKVISPASSITGHARP